MFAGRQLAEGQPLARYGVRSGDKLQLAPMTVRWPLRNPHGHPVLVTVRCVLSTSHPCAPHARLHACVRPCVVSSAFPSHHTVLAWLSRRLMGSSQILRSPLTVCGTTLVHVHRLPYGAVVTVTVPLCKANTIAYLVSSIHFATLQTKFQSLRCDDNTRTQQGASAPPTPLRTLLMYVCSCVVQVR